jgi:hypothetical protein
MLISVIDLSLKKKINENFMVYKLKFNFRISFN